VARRKALVGGWGWAWSLLAQKLVSHHTLERGLLSTLPPLSSRLDLPLFTACLHTLPCNCSFLSAGGPRPGPPAAARPPSHRPGRAPQVRSWHACPALPAQPCLPSLACPALPACLALPARPSHPLRTQLATACGQQPPSRLLVSHSRLLHPPLPPFPCRTEILEESKRIAQPAKGLTDEADRWAAG
jgi:hypothetical protein